MTKTQLISVYGSADTYCDLGGDDSNIHFRTHDRGSRHCNMNALSHLKGDLGAGNAHKLQTLLLLCIMFILTGCQTTQGKMLPEQENFAWYNEVKMFGEFSISASTIGHQLFYTLTHETYPVTIYIDEDQEQATVVYGGNKSNFEILRLISSGTATGATSFHLTDIAGDPTPELVCLEHTGGTGAQAVQCKIIDLSEMKEIPVSIEIDFSEISAVPVEPGPADQMKYQISSASDEMFASVQADTSLCVLGCESELVEANRQWIEVEDHSLTLCTGFIPQEAAGVSAPGTALAVCITELVYDPDLGIVLPSAEYRFR